jgi:hypothetical protein
MYPCSPGPAYPAYNVSHCTSRASRRHPVLGRGVHGRNRRILVARSPGAQCPFTGAIVPMSGFGIHRQIMSAFAPFAKYVTDGGDWPFCAVGGLALEHIWLHLTEPLAI